jgi:hydroxymethylglutaryl-CoA reductase
MAVELHEHSHTFVEGLSQADEVVHEPEQTSRLARLHHDSLESRRRRVEEAAGLEPGTLDGFDEGLSTDQADKMVENVIGVHALPVGIATNFVIDGHEVLVPMAVEEPSVVAAASNGALRARSGGGFVTDVDESLMVAQIEVRDCADTRAAATAVLEARREILAIANASQPELVALGGGAREVETRPFAEARTVVVHLVVDCLDAMGANAVNTMAEALALRIEEITGGRVGLRILSNLSDRRLARARCTIPVASLERRSASGEEVRDGVVAAYEFAAMDPYRAATHNKGIMNGVDAVVIATGNDWRAVEAGAHAYAARSGRYGPLSRWWVGEGGALEGELELPLALGTVGGAARVHPTAKLARKITGVERARDLARIVVSVGLAQNLSALSALATEGIQAGHMALHCRSVALSAGAEGSEVEVVASRLRESGAATVARAREILRDLRRAH